MWLRLLICGVVICSGSSKVLNVHEDVMSFIMGCDGRFRSHDSPIAPTLPVKRPAIDPKTGRETETIDLVNIPQLKKSLQESVGDDEVVTHVLAHVEENLKTRQNVVQRNSEGCTNIKIDVPPQKIAGLSEQLQAVVQQNNYQLLEQVNTLFTFKFNSFFKEVKELLSSQTGKLAEGLVKLNQGQQKVLSQLLKSPQGENTAAGETKVFQTDSCPVVVCPSQESTPSDGNDPLSLNLTPISLENPIPTLVKDPEPLVVESDTIKEPFISEDLDALRRQTPVRKRFSTTNAASEEPLPLRKRLQASKPIEESERDTFLEAELTKPQDLESRSQVPLPEPRQEEAPTEETPEKEEPEVNEEEPPVETAEPRRIGFRRRRPGRIRPRLNRRPPTINQLKDTHDTPSPERDAIDDQQIPEESPQEEPEKREERTRPSRRGPLETLLARRRLLIQKQSNRS